jgi:hypothetical protein
MADFAPEDDGTDVLRSRDAVLRFLKSALQQDYDDGAISRAQFVDLCKSLLHQTMSSPFGSPAWSARHLAELVRSRVSELATRGAAASRVAAPAPAAAAMATLPAQGGAAAAERDVPLASTRDVAALVAAASAAATARLLLREIESSSRMALAESEAAHRATLQCQLLTLRVVSSVAAAVVAARAPDGRRAAVTVVESSAVDGPERPPLESMIHEQQLVLRQLLAKQQALGTTPRRHATPVAAASPRVAAGSLTSSATARSGHGNGTPALTPRSLSKPEVVEFMRQILQPSFNAGVLPAEQFADIVRRISNGLFREGALRHGEHWKSFVRSRIAEEIMLGPAS